MLTNPVNSLISPSLMHEYSWPVPLQQEAWQGLTGQIVETIAPHSEADPAALLVQLLVVCGNMVGHRPVYEVEADEHHMNLFCVLVGETSKSRKGTSWGHVERIGSSAEPEWRARVKSGLVSGEGLIWEVRDCETPTQLEDARLLVFEPELASVLRVVKRKENTLSATVRQAWDTGTLNTLSKNSPAQATGAHISIVGHITRDELARELTTTEVGNGFANRFLWICARRSKLLPEGGSLKFADLTPLIGRFKTAISFGKSVDRLCRDEAARELWAQRYEQLSQGCSGLFGAVTSRAEAQVTRLSCVYALLDQSKIVREGHLRAALEVWRYSEESARYIFRESAGVNAEDKLREALHTSPNGLTRTEISGLFSRHPKASELDQMLNSMKMRGLIDFVPEPTSGRPVERWFLKRNAK
ncbi:MAG: hypothetical protein WCC22_03730 [Terriglobales bacterium]